MHGRVQGDVLPLRGTGVAFSGGEPPRERRGNGKVELQLTSPSVAHVSVGFFQVVVARLPFPIGFCQVVVARWSLPGSRCQVLVGMCLFCQGSAVEMERSSSAFRPFQEMAIRHTWRDRILCPRHVAFRCPWNVAFRCPRKVASRCSMLD